MATYNNLQELGDNILKQDDYVNFYYNWELIKYQVSKSILYPAGRPNTTPEKSIFNLLQINSFDFSFKSYGYVTKSNESWPESKYEDYEALTRLVKELYGRINNMNIAAGNYTDINKNMKERKPQRFRNSNELKNTLLQEGDELVFIVRNKKDGLLYDFEYKITGNLDLKTIKDHGLNIFQLLEIDGFKTADRIFGYKPFDSIDNKWPLSKSNDYKGFTEFVSTIFLTIESIKAWDEYENGHFKLNNNLIMSGTAGVGKSESIKNLLPPSGFDVISMQDVINSKCDSIEYNLHPNVVGIGSIKDINESLYKDYDVSNHNWFVGKNTVIDQKVIDRFQSIQIDNNLNINNKINGKTINLQGKTAIITTGERREGTPVFGKGIIATVERRHLGNGEILGQG